jgi:hypothetical protein
MTRPDCLALIRQALAGQCPWWPVSDALDAVGEATLASDVRHMARRLEADPARESAKNEKVLRRLRAFLRGER